MKESSDSNTSENKNIETKATEKHEHYDLYETIKDYGWKALLLFAPIHYLAYPEDLAVLIVDYLKIPPTVTASMVQYIAPAAAAWLLVWVLILFIALTALIIFIIFGIFVLILTLINKFLKKILTPKYFKGINIPTFKDVEKYFPDIDKHKDIIETIRSGLISFFILVLYLLTIADKTPWSSISNPKILINAQKHYYCQITSGYNQEKCNEVKNK